jgi:hypothetical protein
MTDAPMQDDVALDFFPWFGHFGVEESHLAVEAAFGCAQALPDSIAGALAVFVTGCFDEFLTRVLRLSVTHVPVKSLCAGDKQKECSQHGHNQLDSHRSSPNRFRQRIGTIGVLLSFCVVGPLG